MKKVSLVIITFIFILTTCLVYPLHQAEAKPTIRVYLNNEQVSLAKQPIMIDDRVFVPVRGVLEKLGVKVSWNAKTETITAALEEQKVVLTIGKKEAYKNGALVKLDAPATIVNDTTYVPLRFIGEALGANVTWRSATQSVHINQDQLPFIFPPPLPGPPVAQTKQVTVGGKTYTVQTVELEKGYSMNIGFAQQTFGQTASLEQIAKSYEASAMINGTYFEAYGGKPEPWGTLIHQGQVQHIGSIGATLGLTEDGRAFVDYVQLKVEGTATGTNGWYAYNFNRTPDEDGSAIIIFNPIRGKNIGISYGTSVVVDQGVVKAVQKNTNVSIPPNGYVIHFTGAEEHVANRFKVGAEVDYQIKYIDPNTNKELSYWKDVRSAVGAGPMLVKDGKVKVDPKAEGFTEEKILSQASARSAIGVKKDGTIILATTSGATVQNWAEIMRQLGAYQALNLDGGASSGLYVNDKYMSRAGRELSNVLWFE